MRVKTTRETTHRIDAFSEKHHNLKIERQSDGKTTIIRLIGRVRAERLAEIRGQMGTSSEQTIFDLGEVTIVDADVIQFLSAIEQQGTQLVQCPPYVREWIQRERAEEAGSNSKK